jgi:flagellar basal body-associated protein FliL
MAFCNKCGSTIVAGTRFCNQCGAPILASTLPNTAVPPVAPGPATIAAPPAAGSNNALKVILIVVGVVVLIGILGLVSAGFFAWRIAHHAHVHQDGDNVKVETPFGNVEANKDPDEAARNLGVELYPGAQVEKNNASSATFGGIRTISLTAETQDSVDKVAAYYKAKFPNAVVSSSESSHCTIVSNEHGNIITINIQAEGSATKIQIADVHKGSSNSSSH